MQKIIDWLNTPGRKRAIASVAAVASVTLRHLDGAFRELCAKGFAAVCGWRLDQFSELALKVNVYIDSLTVGADCTAFAFGLVGVFHAWLRRRKQKAA